MDDTGAWTLPCLHKETEVDYVHSQTITIVFVVELLSESNRDRTFVLCFGIK